MDTSVLVWLIVVGIFVAVTLTQAILSAIHRVKTKKVKRIHIISRGTEREEFFVPGDVMREEEVDYDEED